MKLINIPNIITSCNLLCGCLAIYFGFQGDLGYASLSIVGGAVFDFFDGMMARLLHVSGPIGKELDSLADDVTFGVAPSVLCWSLLVKYGMGSWALIAFLMAAFSALRLAKFNCDERQTTSFIGLPTPANALFWIGMVYLQEIPFMQWLYNPVILIPLMLVMSLLLISELPMFSLKIKWDHAGWKDNAWSYSLVIAAVICGIICALGGHFAATPALLILTYIIMSIVKNARSSAK